MDKKAVIEKLKKLKKISLDNGSALSEVKTAEKQYNILLKRYGISDLDIENCCYRSNKESSIIIGEYESDYSYFVNKYINIGKSIKAQMD